MNEQVWLVWSEEHEGAPCDGRVVSAASAEEAATKLAALECEQHGVAHSELPETFVRVAPLSSVRLRVRFAGEIVTDPAEVPRG